MSVGVVQRILVLFASALSAATLSTGFVVPTTSRSVISAVHAPTFPSKPCNGQLYSLKLTAKGDNDSEPGEYDMKARVDPLVKETALLLRRLSWGAWWSQLILTTVSSITLVFARNVIGASTSSGSQIITSSLPNFLLAGVGIGLSFGSIFWTWASRRLARRLLRKSTSKLQTAAMLRKSIKVGVTLNLFGMLTSLISAEQIVGALAIKVLTAAPARTTVALMESSSSFLQPLDILVVQANTNTLFSHFTSLAALLYMTRSLAKLDPPSNPDRERGKR